MASILERTINTDEIENRKVYLQLFFVQRCTDFSNWWRRLLVKQRSEYLRDCGVPLAETPASERLATFPPEFHVDKLLELVDVDGENGTEPLAFRPYDGALRAFAIVADPLTYWAPRVSDEAVDWLNTLTTIVEALVDAYQDATGVSVAQPVWTPEMSAEFASQYWYPKHWASARRLLRARFFPDAPAAARRPPPTRSVLAHRQALAAATRADAIRALDAARDEGELLDDDDARLVAKAMALVAEALSWSGYLEALSPDEAKAVHFGNQVVEKRKDEFGDAILPYQLHFLRGFTWVGYGKAHEAEATACFRDALVSLGQAAKDAARRHADGADDAARLRAAAAARQLFMVAAKSHEGLAYLAATAGDSGAQLAALDVILKLHDWEPHVDFVWRAFRGLDRFHRDDFDGAITDLTMALSGASPDDAEYVECAAGVAAGLYKRARVGDLALGVRYLALARAAAAKRPGADAPTLRRATELYRRHSVAHAEELPEAARGPNTPREPPVLGRPGAAPPEETRIRGSKIPAILRTPRDAPR